MALVLLRDMEDRFMADLWAGSLRDAGIPLVLRTFEDTAYDGLFVSQKGYGRIMVDEERLAQAREIDQGLMASLAASPDQAAQIAGHLDHTLLDPAAGPGELEAFLGECLEMSCAAACVLPWMVPRTAAALQGSPVAVCTVVGFPLGADTTTSKMANAAELAQAGATEIDVVVNRGWLSTGQVQETAAQIAQVVGASRPALVKVIMETGQIGPELSQELALALLDSGAAFLKTGTGFFGPATVEDVELLAEVAAGYMQIKAAGGIRSLDNARQMIEAGATRLGTSSGYRIWLEAGGGE